MKIKEVEQKVGITSANIRFYEKEKLFSPERNADNNYREYSEHDVEVLKKIKLLRVLGVSIPEVKGILNNDKTLEEVVTERKHQLEQERGHLQELQKVCDTILKDHIDFEMLDDTVLNENSDTMKSRLSYILHADISKEEITKQQYNAFVGAGLCTAFLMNALLCLFAGNYFLENVHVFILWICLGVFVVAAFAIHWTAKPIALMINFYAVSLSFSPLFLTICAMVRDTEWQQKNSELSNPVTGIILLAGSQIKGLKTLTNVDITVFMLLIVLFSLLMWVVSVKLPHLFTKCRYGLCMAALYSAVGSCLCYVISGQWLFWMVLLLLFTAFIEQNWIMSLINSGIFNKYRAVVTMIKMVNVPAILISAWGNTESWRRDGYEFK